MAENLRSSRRPGAAAPPPSPWATRPGSSTRALRLREDEIGQEGAELVVSSLQDGLQLYPSIDSFGHMVSLDDISDFENPSVSLSTSGADDFIVVDGKNVGGEAGFMDSNSDSIDSLDGPFQVTCP